MKNQKNTYETTTTSENYIVNQNWGMAVFQAEFRRLEK